MKLKLIRLTKHFGSNNAGEVVGLSPATADHVLKNQGGTLIGDFDDTKNLHVVREVDGEEKDLIVEAVRDPETGTLVEKPAPAPAKKEESKK